MSGDLNTVWRAFLIRQRRLAQPMSARARAGALVRVACDTLLIPLRVLCAGIDGAAVAHRAALSSPRRSLSGQPTAKDPR